MKTEKQRVKEFILKHLKVNNPRGIEDERLDDIVTQLNIDIVDACEKATKKLNHISDERED